MRWSHALPLAALALLTHTVSSQATNWKKYQGEFAGDGSDCIDFNSIKTDAQGLTRFKRYVIDNDKTCGPPNQYNIVEFIAVSCRAVLAAGSNRDDFPVKYYSFDITTKRHWVEATGASRQFARVMQYVCQNRK